MPRLSLLLLLLGGLARAGSDPATAPPVSPARQLGLAETREILFGALPDDAALARCAEAGTGEGDDDARSRIRCLLAARYAGDPKASRLALELYDRTGDVAGLLPEQDFDGGYRGVIHLVPHLPLREDRKHLGFVVGALLGLDGFLADVERQAGAPLPTRWRGLDFRFFRSVKRRTPSAIAQGWTVAYNVRGSLNHSTRAVRDLLFHEIFHLNDFAQGDWSRAVLTPTYESIMARCGQKTGCLAPYAPGWVKVRGGTYYAFTPGNGVEEYAAELAIQYLREQLAVKAGGSVKRPFKCGPPENAYAWKLLVDEFFAGIDRVPACSGKPASKAAAMPGG